MIIFFFIFWWNCVFFCLPRILWFKGNNSILLPILHTNVPYIINGLSPVVIETFYSCVSPDGRNWLSARLPLIFTMASKCTFLLLFCFIFFLTCILDSQVLLFFFFCVQKYWVYYDTEIRGKRQVT